MRLVFGVLFITFISFKSWSTDIDWSEYDLTTDQIARIQLWLEKTNSGQETLLQYIKIVERENQAPQYKIEVPPHSYDQVTAVMRWAEGRAFASFAEKASYVFDSDKYEADCPNMALFNFGMTTGFEIIRADVTQLMTNMVWYLNHKWTSSPETFSEVFIEKAKERHFDVYLTKKQDAVAAPLEVASAAEIVTE